MGNGQSQASNDLSNIGNSIRTGLAGFGGLVNRGVIAPIVSAPVTVPHLQPILTNLGAGFKGLGNDIAGPLKPLPGKVVTGLVGFGQLTGRAGRRVANDLAPFIMGFDSGAREAEKLSGFSEFEKSIEDIKNDPRNAAAYGSLILSMNDLHDTIDNMHEVLKFIENMKESGGDPRKLARLMAEDGVKPLEDVAGGEEEQWWLGYASGFAGLEEAEHPEDAALKKLPSSGKKSGADKKKGSSTVPTIPTLHSGVKVPQNIATPPSGVKPIPIVKPISNTHFHFSALLMASDPDHGTGVYTSHKKHHLHGSQYHHHQKTRPHYVKHIPELHR